MVSVLVVLMFPVALGVLATFVSSVFVGGIVPLVACWSRTGGVRCHVATLGIECQGGVGSPGRSVVSSYWFGVSAAWSSMS